MEAATRPAARPPRADAQRNRERVVAAGREVFAEMGDQARIEEIARRAGVGVGTVYRHFETKEGLMAELLADKWRLMARQVEEELAAGGDAWDVFARTLRRNAEVMLEDAAVRHVLLRSPAAELLEADASVRAKAELSEATAALLARSRDVIRDDLTIADIGLAMRGVCATMDSCPSGPNDWRRHLELVLAGMRA